MFGVADSIRMSDLLFRYVSLVGSETPLSPFHFRCPHAKGPGSWTQSLAVDPLVDDVLLISVLVLAGWAEEVQWKRRVTVPSGIKQAGVPAHL